MCSNQASITFRFGDLVEPVGDEALEDPLAFLNVPAADHEDERLPAPPGDAREVVIEVADRLEVHVELDGRLLDPLGPCGRDAGRANVGPGLAVHIEQGLQSRGRGAPLDGDRLGRHARVRPARDPRPVRLAPLRDANPPELRQVLALLDDLLHGGRPLAGVALGVGAKLIDGRLGEHLPVPPLAAHAPHPLDGLRDLVGEASPAIGGVLIGDGRDEVHAAVDTCGVAPLRLLPPTPQQEGLRRQVPLQPPERAVVDEDLRLVGRRRAGVAQLPARGQVERRELDIDHAVVVAPTEIGGGHGHLTVRERAGEQLSEHVAADEQVGAAVGPRLRVAKPSLVDDGDTLRHRRERGFREREVAPFVVRCTLGHDRAHLGEPAQVLDDGLLEGVPLGEEEGQEVGRLVRFVADEAVPLAVPVEPVEHRVIEHVVARRRGRDPLVPLRIRLGDDKVAAGVVRKRV